MPNVVIVEKVGTLKALKIKELKEDELYKKCGYKKPTNFGKQHTWKIKYENTYYYVSLFAKSECRIADCVNKYEFPPPVDNVLYYGSCILVGYVKTDNQHTVIDLTVDMWEKMYNKLYGGFETLANTEKSDELEPDELAKVPSHKKTKEGYLKDGFVIEDKPHIKSSGTLSSKNISSKKKTDDDVYVTTDTEEDGDDEVESIYTDIDDEDEDKTSSKKKASKKKPIKKTVTKKKAKSSSPEDTLDNSILLTANVTMEVSEIIITDELTEEPYIE
jgi:hypothetical protein